MRNRLLVLLAWPTILSALVAPLLSRPPDKPDPRFGITEAFWEPAEAAELEVGWERILFYWREIQPTGPDDWNTLHVREEWLVEAEKQGRTVVGLLKNTAPWASEDGTEAGLPKGLYLPPEDPDNLWAGFVRKVAEYYSERNVHHWIIWNEPEIRPGVYGHEFSGRVTDYYQLLKIAYRVMKDVDPSAIIHVAGLTWWHDQSYLRRFLEVATNDPQALDNDLFFDVVSLHIYFRTESIQSILRWVTNIQKEFGIDKPVWINETNAPPDSDPMWPVHRPSLHVNLQQQAWFIVQAYALGFAAGAERISVYKLIDIHLPEGGESFGLLRPDRSRRPAFLAYKTMIRYLAGFTAANKFQATNYYVVSFSQPGGITSVMWTRTPSPITVSLDAVAETALLITDQGETKQISAVNGMFSVPLEGAQCDGECLIGGPPMYLLQRTAKQEPDITDLLAELGDAVSSSLAPVMVATAELADGAPTSASPTNLSAIVPTPTLDAMPLAIATRVPPPTPLVTPSRVAAALAFPTAPSGWQTTATKAEGSVIKDQRNVTWLLGIAAVMTTGLLAGGVLWRKSLRQESRD